MDFKNFLEYPLPKIQVEEKFIHININENISGTISIKNIGGGILSGEIISNTEYLVLSKQNFEENDFKVEYEVIPPISSINSEIIIISNGGEVSISVSIAVDNFNYLECGKQRVHSIKEFYQYYLDNNIEAIRLFYSYDFMLWLKKINYEHIDITEEIMKDTNKQKAIDNFFVLSKVKEKAYIKILQTSFRYKYYKNDNEYIIGEIPLKLIGKGHFEEEVSIEKDVEYIYLSKNKITNRDFDTDGNFILTFKINKKFLSNSFEKLKIIFKKMNKSVIIEINKKNPLEVVIDKEYFESTDEGILKIFNNTDKDIMIEIILNDSFILLLRDRYLVSKYLEIPFKIKLAGFLKTQMDFIRRPNIQSQILIKAKIEDNIYKYKKDIYIGNSLI